MPLERGRSMPIADREDEVGDARVEKVRSYADLRCLIQIYRSGARGDEVRRYCGV